MVAYKKLYPEINDDICKCVTCPRVYPIKQLQAGHFVQGRMNSILFDERGCFAQCYGCNMGKGGNIIEYYPFMLKNCGQKLIDELKFLSNQTVKFTIEELKKMEIKFKQKTIEELKKMEIKFKQKTNDLL